MHFTTPLKSNSTKIMLVGSGELGKEVVIEASRLGIETVAVDSYPKAPAHLVANRSYVINMKNKEELLEIAKHDNDWAKEKMSWFLDGRAASRVGRGIYFRNLVPEGFMAVKMEAKIGDKYAEILYAGRLSCDFGGFLCALN